MYFDDRTQQEAERRQRLVDNLNYRFKQMEISVNNPDTDRRYKRCSSLCSCRMNALIYGVHIVNGFNVHILHI